MSSSRSLLRAVLALASVTLGTAPTAAAAGAPTVQSMVVGRGGTILSTPRAQTASAATASVAGRRCAVAAATPLAVLLDLQVGGGPSVALHDYGHCDARAADAGQLFVKTIGGESNQGQDGWEYKVGHIAGSTGAADPSGPLGNGRLLTAGQHVLWFWCAANAGGCQRTLEVSLSSTSTSRRAPLTATVTGYENEGHGAPVVGATVTVGSAQVRTGSGGRATLIAPGTSGRYSVSAAKPGLVPSFPETLTVK